MAGGGWRAACHLGVVGLVVAEEVAEEDVERDAGEDVDDEEALQVAHRDDASVALQREQRERQTERRMCVGGADVE